MDNVCGGERRPESGGGRGGRDQRLVEEVPSRAGGAVYTSLDVDCR